MTNKESSTWRLTVTSSSSIWQTEIETTVVGFKANGGYKKWAIVKSNFPREI